MAYCLIDFCITSSLVLEIKVICPYYIEAMELSNDLIPVKVMVYGERKANPSIFLNTSTPDKKEWMNS